MWSPVIFVLFVASVRADAEADADAEPFLPYVYPQYNFGNSWASMHFGTPQETLDTKVIHHEEDAAYRPSLDFFPATVAHSPFFAIRNVQAPPPSILQLQKPVETHDVQLLRHPALMFRPHLVFHHTSHVRVPDYSPQIPQPGASAPASTFASQHTAQVPFFMQRPTIPNFLQTVPVHIPVAAPSFAIQHSAQVPIFPSAFAQKIDDEMEDDDEEEVNLIFIPHFPTELASLTSLRGIEDEPVIPAGIVQSTQPSFRPVQFVNSKAHPSLLGKVPNLRDASVIAA